MSRKKFKSGTNGKRTLGLAGCLLLAAFLFAGCGPKQEEPEKGVSGETGKIQVIATLFPQYDFARQVGGEHVQVQLLLPPGMESHSFEPSASDIISIGEADLFIYTGKYMEGWADKMLSNVGEKVQILDVSEHIALEEEEHEEGEEAEGHLHEYEPHIWTNPMMAKVMVQNIVEALCKTDPANEADYRENGRAYCEKLDNLDSEIKEIVKNGKRKEIVFGGRFALRYFCEQYGLEAIAAFDSCSSETEPSVKVMTSMIDKIREDGIPVVYYEELSNTTIADSVSEATGAEVLLFHSAHNVSKADFERGITYLEIMEQNAENLKKGLN